MFVLSSDLSRLDYLLLHILKFPVAKRDSHVTTHEYLVNSTSWSKRFTGDVQYLLCVLCWITSRTTPALLAIFISFSFGLIIMTGDLSGSASWSSVNAESFLLKLQLWAAVRHDTQRKALKCKEDDSPDKTSWQDKHVSHSVLAVRRVSHYSWPRRLQLSVAVLSGDDEVSFKAHAVTSAYGLRCNTETH